MPRVVISGWYGHANVGDEAILTAIVQVLRANIPGLDITVFSDDPVRTQKAHGVNALPHPIFPLGRQTGASFKHAYLSSRTTLAAFRGANLFLLGGGGLLHDYRGAVYPWLWEVLLAKAAGTPVALYAVGVGPLQRRLSRILTRILLSRVDLITVRDSQSKTLLQQMGVRQPQIEVTADPAILLHPLPSPHIPPALQKLRLEATDGPFLGVSLRPWFTYLARDPATGQDAQQRFEMLMAQLVDRWIEQLGARVVFIPFHASDVVVCRNVLNAMTHAIHACLLEKAYTPREWISLLAMMDVVVGMRLHALVLAANAGIPVIGLRYDPKISSFMQAIGQAEFEMDITQLHVEQGVIVLERVWQQREKVRVALQYQKARLCQKAIYNGRLVAGLVQTGAVDRFVEV